MRFCDQSSAEESVRSDTERRRVQEWKQSPLFALVADESFPTLSDKFEKRSRNESWTEERIPTRCDGSNKK